MKLTGWQLGHVIDRNSYKPKQEDLVAALNAGMAQGKITTPRQTAMFLAQVLHETGGFRWFAEIGDDAYFAKYEGRKDLGNACVGDGAKFKGRGFIQITGRDNYAKAGAALKIDLLERPRAAEGLMIGALIAGWFWRAHGCNAPAEMGDLARVTRLINGGLNGLDERQQWYDKACDALGIERA